VDGFLRLRTLTHGEELSLALDMIELELAWVGVEFDSLLLVVELVRAARPAAMAIREVSTPRTIAQVAKLMAHIIHPSLHLPSLDGRSMILVFVILSLFTHLPRASRNAPKAI
jgi:hypothetical protein